MGKASKKKFNEDKKKSVTFSKKVDIQLIPCEEKKGSDGKIKSVKEFRKMLSAKKKLLKKNRKLNLQDSPGCSTEILKFLTPSKTRNVLKRKAKSGTPIWKRIQLCRWKTKKSPKILQPKKESQLKSPDYTKGCSSSHATNTAQKSVTDNAKISSFVDLSDPKENSEAEENNKKIPNKINSGKNSYNSNCLDVSILRGNSNIKTTKESKEINELPILNTSNHKNDHISQLDLDENIELFRKIKPKKNKFRSLVKGGEYLPLSPNTNNHQKVDKSEFLEEILECSFDSNTSTESLMSSDNNTSLAPTFNENEPVVELTPPPKSKLISTGGFICVDRFKDTSELVTNSYLVDMFDDDSDDEAFNFDECAVDFLPRKAEADDVLCALFD